MKKITGHSFAARLMVCALLGVVGCGEGCQTTLKNEATGVINCTKDYPQEAIIAGVKLLQTIRQMSPDNWAISALAWLSEVKDSNYGACIGHVFTQPATTDQLSAQALTADPEMIRFRKGFETFLNGREIR